MFLQDIQYLFLHGYQFVKGIGLKRVSFISEERGWKDWHFATHLMKIGGSVS